MYFVYLIESLKDDKYYLGQTNNLEERLKYHNTGRCKYTKIRWQWILKVYKVFPTQTEAMREEKKLKQLKNRTAIEIYFGIEAWDIPIHRDDRGSPKRDFQESSWEYSYSIKNLVKG